MSLVFALPPADATLLFLSFLSSSEERRSRFFVDGSQLVWDIEEGVELNEAFGLGRVFGFEIGLEMGGGEVP